MVYLETLVPNYKGLSLDELLREDMEVTYRIGGAVCDSAYDLRGTYGKWNTLGQVIIEKIWFIPEKYTILRGGL